MAFYTIFSHSIKTSYKTKLFSESTLFYILCIISNLLIPIVVIYKSDGLWRKVEFYREQPDINFKHNLILLLQLKDSYPGFKFWSTYSHLNQAFRSDQISVPFIRVSLCVKPLSLYYCIAFIEQRNWFKFWRKIWRTEHQFESSYRSQRWSGRRSTYPLFRL